MGVSKIIDYIQIKIKMPNPSQEHPTSSKAPNQKSKSLGIFVTFNIEIESQISQQGFIKGTWTYSNPDQDAKPKSETSTIL